MRIRDLMEATPKLGLVFSYVSGKFEDIELVDWNTQSAIRTGQPYNIFKGMISTIKNKGNNDFAGFAKFARKQLQGGRKLGSDYADQEDGGDLFIMYPVDNSVLSQLDDQFVDGLSNEKDDEVGVDEHVRHGVRQKDFY